MVASAILGFAVVALSSNEVGLISSVIGAVTAIVVAVIEMSAASRRQKRELRYQRKGSGMTGFLLALLLVSIVSLLYFANRPKEEARASSPPTVPTVAPTDPPPVASAVSSACPTRAEFEAATNPKFTVVDPPPEKSRMVLQLKAHTVGGTNHFVVSICRDPSSSYWYFSRQQENPASGLVARATLTEVGFEAHNRGTVYTFAASGGSAKGGGADFAYDIDQFVCAGAGEVPQSFVEQIATACTDTVIEPWRPVP